MPQTRKKSPDKYCGSCIWEILNVQSISKMVYFDAIFVSITNIFVENVFDCLKIIQFNLMIQWNYLV